MYVLLICGRVVPGPFFPFCLCIALGIVGFGEIEQLRLRGEKTALDSLLALGTYYLNPNLKGLEF